MHFLSILSTRNGYKTWESQNKPLKWLCSDVGSMR